MLLASPFLPAVSFEKSVDSLMGTLLEVTLCFSLAAFKILSLYFTFGILIMMCLGMVLFRSNFFGTLCASWTYMSISFSKLRNFSFLIFSNKFSISCCSSSPSVTPMIWMLARMEISQSLLKLSLFFFLILFLLSVLVGCLFFPFVPNLCFESWFPSCHC